MKIIYFIILLIACCACRHDHEPRLFLTEEEFGKFVKEMQKDIVLEDAGLWVYVLLEPYTTDPTPTIFIIKTEDTASFNNTGIFKKVSSVKHFKERMKTKKKEHNEHDQ